MKYMILLCGSQRDYDAMAGKPGSGKPAWTGPDFAALGTFMEEPTSGQPGTPKPGPPIETAAAAENAARPIRIGYARCSTARKDSPARPPW